MPLSLRMVSFSASFCWLGWITPRDIFLAVRLNLQINAGKNITNLHSLWSTKKEGAKEAVICVVVRFRPCSDFQGQLPVLHPTVSCLCFSFFSVTGMRRCPGFPAAFRGTSLRKYSQNSCSFIGEKTRYSEYLAKMYSTTSRSILLFLF